MLRYLTIQVIIHTEVLCTATVATVDQVLQLWMTYQASESFLYNFRICQNCIV